MSNTVYIFKPSSLLRYTKHFDLVQGFIDEIIIRNQELFTGQLRFFAYFTPPLPSHKYYCAGVVYRRGLGEDDPLKACTPFELFKEMSAMAKKLKTTPPKNPSTAPALEIVGPIREQYQHILDLATSETFEGLNPQLPDEVRRFVAFMGSNKTLDSIVLPHIGEKGFNVKIELVRNA